MNECCLFIISARQFRKQCRFAMAMPLVMLPMMPIWHWA